MPTRPSRSSQGSPRLGSITAKSRPTETRKHSGAVSFQMQRSALATNSRAYTGELHAAHAGVTLGVDESALSGAGLHAEIKKAIANLQLDKSAGVDGNIYKCGMKGDFVRAHPEVLTVGAFNRIRRLVALGALAGKLTAEDKARCALRSLVNPQVKQEDHALNKVFFQAQETSRQLARIREGQ